MKIKFFYQQFLSHLSVIIVALIVLGVLFGSYMEDLVYKNKQEELVSYGNNILFDIGYSPMPQIEVLRNYKKVLSARRIDYILFDEDRHTQYPASGRINIEEEEWEKIKNGQIVTVKQDFKRFDEGVTIVLLPYFQHGVFAGGLMIASPISGSSEMISDLYKYLLLTAVIALCITLFLSWFISKYQVNRIKKIQEAASKVADGDYSVRVPSTHFDEIGELSDDFNTMVDKINESMEEIHSLENRRRRFMADVSHELRTPLTTISGVIEGLRDNMIEEEEREKGLNLIRKESRRMLRLVNENLDYEKIRSNQITLQIERIDVFELLDIIREQLSVLAEEKNIEIRMDVEKGLTVDADYDRLTQIIINIVKNSIQFTKEGHIWMRAKKGYQETILEIEDTGIGIEADEIEKIWRRFYKAEISRTTNPYGEFGLGLAIVQQLVELHQGYVEVSSEKGKGTTFTIHIPYEKNPDLRGD